MTRYNDNYQCKGCGVEVTEELLGCVMDFECQACGGRIWVKTHKHRGAVTVDGERFVKPKKLHSAALGMAKLEYIQRRKIVLDSLGGGC